MSENRNLAYWLCQLLGWMGWSLILLGFAILEDGNSRQMVMITLTSVAGLVLTHVFRTALKPRDWVHSGVSSMIPKAGFSVLVLMLLLFGLEQAIEMFWPGMKPKQTTMLFSDAPSYWVHLINYAVVLGLWVFIYLTVHLVWEYADTRINELRLEAGLKSAKLQALEYQLNPHFLFNSLNSIAELTTEDPLRARHMVLRLSSLLRTTLQAGKADVHPLEKEVNLAKAYLELESMRFEERLKYSFEVDPGFLSLPVPVMLILTLVENSIKHGIAKQIKGGEVHVVVEAEQGGLSVHVTNTGQMEEQESSSGVGLRNLKERLRILYGDQAWLTIQNVKARKVRATIGIPLSS